MHATKCQWNPDGSILAIIGSTVVLGDTKETNIIQFFSPLGEVFNANNVFFWIL